MRWDTTSLSTAAAVLLAAAPALAASPTTSTVDDGTTRGQQDTATDADGTIHLGWGRFEPDPRPTARYCRIAPGTAVCAPGSTRVLEVPPHPNENISYAEAVEVLRPGGDRVVVVLGVSLGNFSRSVVFESTDGGATFGAGRDTGLDKPGNGRSYVGGGLVLQGSTITHLRGNGIGPIRVYRSPIGAAGPAAFDLWPAAGNGDFRLAGTNDAMVAVAFADTDRLQFRRTRPGGDPATNAGWTPSAPVPGGLTGEWDLESAPDGAYLYAHASGSPSRTVSKWTAAGGWGPPVEIPGHRGNVGFGNADVGTAANGVASATWHFTGPDAGTCLSQSTDGGASWSVPVLAGRDFGTDHDVSSAGPGQGLLLLQGANGNGGIKALTLTPDPDNPCTPPPPAPPAPPTTTPPPTGTPPTTTPPTTTTRPAIKASRVLALPATKRCSSRRAFRIRVRKFAGVRYSRVVVRVNGKQVKALRGARDTALVSLKGLPKGRFTVKITLTTTDGRTVNATRKYRTCMPKRGR